MEAEKSDTLLPLACFNRSPIFFFLSLFSPFSPFPRLSLFALSLSFFYIGSVAFVLVLRTCGWKHCSVLRDAFLAYRREAFMASFLSFLLFCFTPSDMSSFTSFLFFSTRESLAQAKRVSKRQRLLSHD